MSTESTKSNLDLILKWATIRFFDTNPSVLIRILEYLSNVFEVLSDQGQGYSMSDVEATAFIPYLVTKLGESKENMRSSVHTILRHLANVYVPQRIFAFITEGLKSKNSRQRTDCLDESAHMIEVHGINVMMPSPQIALKEMAKQISDRDTNVRNAALNAIVQAYFLQGEKVYKMIGAVSLCFWYHL
jgi:cytoskeleton-associated protein 5